LSRADNPHAFSRPEYNLRFTDKQKKQNKKKAKKQEQQTNDRGLSV
jgi:hypothetical protein